MIGWVSGALAVIVVGVALAVIGGCSPLVALNDVLVPSGGYTRSGDLAYGSDPRQRLDVYAPTGEVATATPRPVVVFFYGGSWRSGRRDLYRFVGEAFAGKGFVTVVPDYRLYPEVLYPAFVDDGARAVRWARDHAAAYGGDPDRIVLVGHSAGAHTAAMLAVDDRFLNAAGVPRDSVRAVIGLAGPYAFDPFKYRTIRPVFAAVGSAADMQPGTYVDGTEPPMLLAHGTRDRTVYPVNSHELARRVRATGGRAEIVDVDGVGHIGLVLALAYPLRAEGGVLDQVATFAWEHVAPPSAAADDAGERGKIVP